MKKVIWLIFFIAIICGCHRKPHSDQGPQPTAQNNSKKNPAYTNLNFGEPVQIDSSKYVMFPLEIKHDESSFSLKSSGKGFYYWNVIFLNTETGRYHLLDSARKMLIADYGAETLSNKYNTYGNSSAKNYLFYSIIVNDINKDGLNDNDPRYLYVSDKEGKNFKQISPDNYDVISWKVIGETDEVLLYTVNSDDKEPDNDKKEIIPFVYDLKKGSPAHQIFNKNFIESTKNLFNNQWSKPN